MTAAQLATRQQNAIRKAQALGLCATVEGGPRGHYMVDCDSRAHPWHYVDVAPDGTYRCDCAAGREGVPCKHAAAVWLVRRGLCRARITLRAAIQPARRAA